MGLCAYSALAVLYGFLLACMLVSVVWEEDTQEVPEIVATRTLVEQEKTLVEEEWRRRNISY